MCPSSHTATTREGIILRRYEPALQWSRAGCGPSSAAFFHAEAARAVVPKREANIGDLDVATRNADPMNEKDRRAFADLHDICVPGSDRLVPAPSHHGAAPAGMPLKVAWHISRIDGFDVLRRELEVQGRHRVIDMLGAGRPPDLRLDD